MSKRCFDISMDGWMDGACDLFLVALTAVRCLPSHPRNFHRLTIEDRGLGVAALMRDNLSGRRKMGCQISFFSLPVLLRRRAPAAGARGYFVARVSFLQTSVGPFSSRGF